MIWILLRELSDGSNGVFEADSRAQTFPLDTMSNNGRPLWSIMYIYLYTLYSSHKIFDVSLHFAVTVQLIASEISIMRTVTEVVSQRQFFINWCC